MKASSRNKLLGDLLGAPSPAPAAASDDGAAAAAGRAAQRIGSGTVGALKDSLAHLVREGRVVELDVAQVDPSPFPDRLDPHDGGESHRQLVESIRVSGQEVPVLVRPHPEVRDRYQIVYGHRRLRAVADLGDRKIKAVIRELDDADLLVAQGIENSARQDLSWIEKAMFARRLEAFAAETGGDGTRMVMEALGIHAPDASRFRTTLEVLPYPLVAFIGSAPRIGRTKWLALADVFRRFPERRAEIDARVASGEFGRLTSDERFSAVLRAATEPSRRASAGDEPSRTVMNADGTETLALFQEFGKASRLQLQNKAFGRYLAERLPELFEDFAGRNRHGD